jgi:heavy metal translocating P-type ATPase
MNTDGPLTEQSSVFVPPAAEAEVMPPQKVPAPEAEHDHVHDDHEHALGWVDFARIGLVAVAAVITWLRVWQPWPHLDVIALIGTIAGGYPIFREAFENLRARRMTMELSMTIALVAALAVEEFLTALLIVLFVLIAEVLESLTVDRGRRAIERLLELLPRTAVVRREGDTLEVDIDEVQPGEVVVVKPGARIPVDGSVIAGNSFVDQAAITGESMPAEKLPGARVYAGSINQSGVLDVCVEGIGPDTAFGRIIQEVERAEKSRAPVQRTADRLAGYLVYFALACAALTFLVTRDAKSTISVVVVAGACGIAAGTPLAILGAIGRAAHQGIIVKGGLYMETLAHVDTVVLDKTGTLTLGTPHVTAVEPRDGVTTEAVMAAVGAAERSSEHPLASAVHSKAKEMGLSLRNAEQFSYEPGKGIVCTVDGEEVVAGSRAFLEERQIALGVSRSGAGAATEVLVARNGSLLGTLHIEDVIRPETIEAVAAMRKLGLRIVMLTGDSAAVARAVARQVGIEEVVAELLPEQKVDRIRALVAEGRTVAMVGDGINDAPALAEASVGVAIGSGTDVARESADVVLLGNDLVRFVDTLRLARRCRSIILFNFAGTLAVDGVGVLLAACGFLTPLLAVFIHVGSELAFILNSSRLLPAPGKRR